MIFIALTFLAAFSIEGLGTLVSVIGLSALFGSNPIIIALAIALDLGKIVVVSFLYTYWKKMGKIMKTYALLASAVTMIITSAGAAGYLSGEFQKAIIGTQETGLKVDVLKQQQAKYEERKKQIDDQVAKIPDKYTANQRIRVTNQFKAEQADLQAKITAIDTQLPDLQIAQISVEAKAGPILYIAKAFDIPVEAAVKYVILLIIFVFDPLAVFLIIAGNFLLQHRRDETGHSELTLFSEDDITTVPLDKAIDFSSDVKETNINDIHIGDDGAIRYQILNPHKFVEPLEEKIFEMKIEEGDSLPPIREPVIEEPVIEEPVIEEPVIEEPVIEEPVIEEPVIEEPVIEEPVIEEPVIEEQRETITLSSLGLSPVPPPVHVTTFDSVKADPLTDVDASQTNEISSFQSSPYPRPTKKRPTR